MVKESEERKIFREIPINNPFIRDPYIWDRENELFDKIKTWILTLLLVPIRVILIVILLLFAWSLAYVGLYGYTRQDLKLKPLRGWRRKLRSVVGFLFRSMFFVGSANWITVKGKMAPPEEAPILVGAPHSSFFDALAALISGPSSVVGKVEAGEIPFYGKLIDMAQPIYVCREDHNSRATTIQDILIRVKSISEWQEIGRILIFPEGTCTNRESLIQFKPGAFYPGQPVQPVLIRYPNKIDTCTWTWQGPNVFILLWRTLAQFHNYIEIEFLPTYIPSEEEIKNPKLYAQNVQQLMAKHLNLPISDYAFDDCKLMEYAQRCKLFFASKIADAAKLREKIGLASSQIEEYIVKENFPGTEDYYIKFEEFVQRLKIPADNYSYTLFKLFVDTTKVTDDVIDFKEYLLHALLLIKMQEAKIQLVRLLFMLYGDGGRLPREGLHQVLKHFLTLPPKKIDQLFYSLDDDKGFITFDDFNRVAEKDDKFRRLYEPNRNFRPKQTH